MEFLSKLKFNINSTLLMQFMLFAYFLTFLDDN